jgi:hypothetical protein
MLSGEFRPYGVYAVPVGTMTNRACLGLLRTGLRVTGRNRLVAEKNRNKTTKINDLVYHAAIILI